MFLSFYKGSAVGSLVGICIGASLCITPSFRYLFPCYALSGLVSGLISPLGQIATALAFAVTYSLAGLFQTADSEILISLIEVAIASAAFMIMPASWISSLGDTLKKSGVIDLLQEGCGQGESNIFLVEPRNPNMSTRKALMRAQPLLGTRQADISIYTTQSK
jgi:uncharacterized membrane protein